MFVSRQVLSGGGRFALVYVWNGIGKGHWGRGR